MMDYARPTEEFLRTVKIRQLLPQQPPFVMVDTLVRFSMEVSVTETSVREDNIFVEGGRLSAPGMMENIAQTCAARVGYYNKYVLHNDVKIGFIGAIKDFTVNRTPCVGETIVTAVDILEEIFGMTLARATVTCGGETLACAEIKLSVKDS
mgnify:CR=1 FL=1